MKTVFKTCIVYLLILGTGSIYSQDCMTSECHVDKSKLTVFHSPVEDGCDSCHEEGENHKFTLIAEGNALCYECHDSVEEKENIHPTIDEGCISCHNPHGGNKSPFLKNTTMIDTCMECHDTVNTEAKSVHSPVEEDDCTSCHNPHSSDYSSLLNNKMDSLCYECHDDKEYDEDSINIHPAMDDGCTTCHNPHNSNHSSLLNSEESGLCAECHDDKSFDKTMKIHPALDDGCSSCHNPHASKNKTLLNTSGDALCLECHDDKDMSVEGMKGHTALDDGCESCHNPHASTFDNLLSSSSKDMCSECHDDKEEEVDNSEFPHKGAQYKKKCLNCHDAHGSKYGNNLVKSTLPLCLGCHKKTSRSSSGKAYNIKKNIEKMEFLHSPVEEEDCSSCHNVHGGSRKNLLTGNYPQKLYRPFSEESYDLCFQCHDSTLVTEQITSSDTDFRNGDRNLHFVHVNQEKGRTCRICHEVHAGPNPKMVNDDVAFKTWDLPIGFTKTDTGGSCQSGCHKKLDYDREQAVIYKKQGEE